MAFKQEYVLLQGSGAQDLVDQVNSFLSNGWRCLGGPVMGGYEVFQAVVRDVHDEHSS